MTVLRQYFASGPWWDLRPAQALLAAQPGDEDARRFVAAARTVAGDWTVVYLPVGVREIELRGAGHTSARWFDPRTGYWRPATAMDGGTGVQTFVAPSGDDWVLDLRR
jgi:hypothetical protein